MRYSLAQRPPIPTVRIVMLKTTKGAPDGITTVEYVEGQEYDVPEDLAGAFFSTHSADPAEAHEAVAEAAEQTHADPVTTPRRRAKK